MLRPFQHPVDTQRNSLPFPLLQEPEIILLPGMTLTPLLEKVKLTPCVYSSLLYGGVSSVWKAEVDTLLTPVFVFGETAQTYNQFKGQPLRLLRVGCTI